MDFQRRNGCDGSEHVSPRVLIVIHGREPAGWVGDACRAVSMFTNPIVRVLAVVDLAFPPFTSLTPFARRAYQQATAYWRGQQELSIQRVIDQIVPALPEAVDFVWLRPVRGHMRQAVTRYVLEWPADVVVIAPPASGVRSWLWFGQACNRLLLHSTCAVIVTAGGVDKARQ